MKNATTSTALILALGLTASASFAADSSPRARMNTVQTSEYFAQSAPSVLSRAEVKAEVISTQQARAHVNAKETSVYFTEPAPSVLSRAAVKADLQQAQKTGALPRMGEQS